MATTEAVLRQREAKFSSSAVPKVSINQRKSSNVRVVARIRPQKDAERHLQAVIQPVVLPQSTEENDSYLANTEASSLKPRKNPLLFLTPTKRKKKSRRPSLSTTPQTRNSYKSLMPQQKQVIATSLLVGKGNAQKQFDFDTVVTPETTQKELYELSVGDSVRRNLFRGYNTTIFAYGQTGSGKTYTMSGRSECDRMELAPTGPSSRDGSETRTFGKSCSIGADDGIIPRAVHDLFKAKQDYESSGEVSITMTFMEIYNEEIFDLMTEVNTGLKLRDHGDEGIVVKGLTIVKVLSTDHARALIDRASNRRRTASTNMNMRSSRSHAICTFSVAVNPTARSNESTAVTLGSRTSQLISAKLTLIDLAGSERLKQTGAIGTAQKESININKDLFVLGKVVSALAEKNKGNTKIHIPYRDSNLTRLLRDSIGGK